MTFIMTPKGVPVVNSAETLRFNVLGVSSEPSVGAIGSDPYPRGVAGGGRSGWLRERRSWGRRTSYSPVYLT